jgi:hypothetical protein
MSAIEKISKLISNQFPSFYKEEAPLFLAFMEAYYEYMEQEGKMSDAVRNLQSYQDISTTTEEFIQHFIKSFLPSVPQNVLADKKLMVKYITQFNQSRGTLAAYKLLFRAIYNEDVSVSYPADQILKVSDGDWRKDRYLIVPYDPITYRFIGKTIIGVSSGSQALVEDIVRRKIRGRDMLQLLLSNIAGKFFNVEPIKLINDNTAVPHAPIIEAGIDDLTIESVGAEYRIGDVVELLSNKVGKFAKVVVTAIENLGGTITFDLQKGGSGYTASTQENGTEIKFIGGDGTDPASFIIDESDIVDKFAIAMCTTLVGSNTIFGTAGPIVSYANGATLPMSNFANVCLAAADFGFREDGEQITSSTDYRDQQAAKLVIANTSDPSVNISTTNSIYGVTSSANATIVKIARGYNSTDIIYNTKGYKKFQVGEKINLGSPTGTTIGTVSAYYANTIGAHELSIGWIANTQVSPLLEGTELVGRTSGAYGVVRRITSLTANGYTRSVGGADDRDLYTVYVSANNTANISSQFDSGPMMHFIQNEGLRVVGANTTVGNVVFTTSNTTCENIYTKLQDSILFETTTFGTIAKISLPIGGSGYSVAPRVEVKENNIAALGIGEQYITLQSDDVNWGTGNSSFTKLDTNDKVLQANTQTSGDVKAGAEPNKAPSVSLYANGTYEMTVRVWQDFGQRTPGNKYYEEGQFCDLVIYDSSYTPGEGDNRTPVDYGTAKITKIVDMGVLGDNAFVATGVGANGTITGLRVLDSGFGYRDKELVTLETPNRNLATSATVTLSLGGVANSEGYYATSRSQLDTARGYIQDSNYYQEYSYEILSALSLDRYRDYALELVHPAGQKLFGKYRAQSNAVLNVTANTSYQRNRMFTGTISIDNGSKDVTGSGTNFTQVANGDMMIIEYAPKEFYKIPINIVSSDTSANLTISWSNTSISGANAYYVSGSFNGNL